MKGILFILTLCILCSCNTNTNNSDQEQLSSNTEDNLINHKEVASEVVDSATTLKKPQKPLYYRYVSASSGLNFRDAPDGKVLGKFPLNTYIAIMENTSVHDNIHDAGGNLSGKWVKVRTYKEPVYVFDAFLSESYTEQEPITFDLTIYPMMVYNGDEYSQFVSLGDARMGNYEDQNAKTLKLNLTIENEWVHLSKKDRKDYLNYLKLKENDPVNVYEYYNNQRYSFKINELPLIAIASPYDPTDYFVGLDFKGKLSCDKKCYQSFIAIGTENPFSNQGVTPILWEPISTTEIDKPVLNYNYFYKDDYVINEASVFRLDGYEYQYLKVSFKDEELTQGFVIIKNPNKEVIKQFQLTSSEGHGPTEFRVKGNVDFEFQYSQQFAGVLFKDQPQAYFSFFNYYYDCNVIRFVDTTIPSIRISCDNRH